jgi:hypothetical protein
MIHGHAGYDSCGSAHTRRGKLLHAVGWGVRTGARAYKRMMWGWEKSLSTLISRHTLSFMSRACTCIAVITGEQPSDAS